MDLYYSSDANIVSIVAFPPLGNSADVVSVYIDFPLNSVGDVSFHCTAYDNSRDDWNGLWDHLRDVPLENMSSLLLLLLNFVSGLRLELMYISGNVNIMSRNIYPHGFKLLLLLP